MRLCVAVALVVFALPAMASDMDEIKTCLKNWSKHPFEKGEPDFRTIGAKVRVMGVGDEIADTNRTEKPELILVKPTVSVMSKSTIRLLNPNGWYCLKSNVAVMGKTEIEIDCHANLTSSNTGATILGKDDSANSGAVTVMGKNSVRKVNCAL